MERPPCCPALSEGGDLAYLVHARVGVEGGKTEGEDDEEQHDAEVSPGERYCRPVFGVVRQGRVLAATPLPPLSLV